MAEFKHIVRIASADLDGNKQVALALTGIKGIGYSFARNICNSANIDYRTKIGHLNDAEIKKLVEVTTNITKTNIPSWSFNTKNQCDTGGATHLITSNLLIANRDGLVRMKKVKSYRGIRHALGLKLRGQRTKSTGRFGKGLGVSRKKIKQAQRKEARK